MAHQTDVISNNSLPAIGTLLDKRFLLVRLLARTELSSVYEGYDYEHGGRVAIKLLARHRDDEAVPTDAQMRALFRREARILGQLNHPQFPRLYAAALDRAQPYLVMSYIDGMTLERLLKRVDLPSHLALAIAHRLCEAIVYLHHQLPPIIHADLKPSNIIVTPEGNIMVIDFGLAQHCNEEIIVVMGTPGYTPEEQWRGTALDQRSDLYALARVLDDVLKPMTTPAIHVVLARAAAAAPQQRYPSVVALSTALRQAAGLSRPAATVMGRSSPMDMSNAVCVLVIVVIVVALYWLYGTYESALPHTPQPWMLPPVPALLSPSEQPTKP